MLKGHKVLYSLLVAVCFNFSLLVFMQRKDNRAKKGWLTREMHTEHRILPEDSHNHLSFFYPMRLICVIKVMTSSKMHFFSELNKSWAMCPYLFDNCNCHTCITTIYHSLNQCNVKVMKWKKTELCNNFTMTGV